MTQGSWTLTYLELSDGTSPYETFLKRLNPYQRVVVTTALEAILAVEGIAVCRTEWGKSLGGGCTNFGFAEAFEQLPVTPACLCRPCRMPLALFSSACSSPCVLAE